MKILSFPFSIYSNSGGCRILRRLYQGREALVTSLVITEFQATPLKGNVEEVFVSAVPLSHYWMRWYLRDWITLLRKNVFRFITITRAQRAAKNIPYDVIHVLNHGSFSAVLCNPAFCGGKLLWVSFHDHFLSTNTPRKDTDVLWNNANRRLVISDELGIEYQNLFGNKPYEIITDGVSADEVSKPSATIGNPVMIYFAGMLHLHYMPLFNVLAEALELLNKQGLAFKLILRGTQQLEFLRNRSFEIEYRPVTLDDTELKEEMETASILYLPMKFTTSDFYLYSLSTKMVGPGTIIYHGPIDSAACRLLQKENAAVCCGSLEIAELVENINSILLDQNDFSANAKLLAKSKFNLNKIQQKFWLG